MRPAARKPSP
uniref:Uncharacterized protein n=1 Tax=Romanomermis culicivorax TaxID=13658 RepID=A0A915IYP3_ROMCU